MPPLKSLEEFSATQELKRLGITTEQLAASRFSTKYTDSPFQEWPFTWPKGMTLSPASGFLSLLRKHLAYRYALTDGVEAGGLRVSEAWEEVAQYAAAPLIDLGVRHRAAQSAKAKKRRGLLVDLGISMADFIRRFSRKPKLRDLRPRELWPEFFGELDSQGLDPTEHGKAYEYDFNGKRKRVSFRTFVKLICEERNKLAH